jgi:4-hydroxy-tetrahydrodipicolinate synthase
MNALDRAATGVYLITVTPFTDSGELDLVSTDRMVDFLLETGVTGLTVLGIMGEAPKLTAQESRIFVKQVLARVAGRVPVVVGASAAGFAPMRELTESVMDMGAAGVMVAPPGTVKPTNRSWPTSTWSTKRWARRCLGCCKTTRWPPACRCHPM